MAKGVKKIKWTGKGRVLSNLSIPNIKVVIPADEEVFFEVESWYDQTPETDKKKDVTWILQDRKKKTIIVQRIHSANAPQRISIPKPLCGPFEYYIEASLSGKRDLANSTGLRVSGHCTPKIVSSKWCITNDSKDAKNDHIFKYGEITYLNLMTEGLNGHLNLSIDVFRKSDDKKALHRYTSVDVIDGEINLALKNTFSWYGKLKDLKEIEEFYVKVFDPANKLYIPNSGQETAHAKYLKINKSIVIQEIKPPVNLSPLKTGQPEKSKQRYELCRFETINITEPKKKPIRVFDKGEKLKHEVNPKIANLKTILFDFDKSNVTAEAQNTLNNVLQYLLNSQHSYIKIDGHACVIGKEQYNQKLSQQRSDAVKKIFVDGGLDGNRIISIGRGEVNPTDDKQGRDNLKYRDEKDYVANRRVDIMFDSFGHDADTIIFETIAPSHDQNLTIDITEYQNKACFKEKGKHKKNIRINSTEYSKPIDQVISKLDFPVKSNLSPFNLFPLKYIWPKVFANEYNIHVHSCRYFSNDANATVKVMVYPDIKWELAFELKIDIEHYSNTNMPSEYSIFEKHQKKAREAGYKRWLMSKKGKVPIKIGVGLKAEWDEGKQKLDLVKDFEKKIEGTAKIFSNSVEVIQNAINICRNVAKETSIPVSFGVEYPKIETVCSWYLQKEPQNAQIAIVGEISFGAKPLIGANVTIDLIAAIVTAASYSTTGSPAISKIVQKIRDAGKNVGAEISAEAKFYGQLEIVVSDLGINSLTGIKGGKLMIGGKMGITVTIKATAGDIEIQNKVIEAIIPKVAFQGDMDTSFGGDLIIDSDAKGIYTEAIIKFGGLKLTLDIKVEVGWFTRSYHIEEIVLKDEKKSIGKKYITN